MERFAKPLTALILVFGAIILMSMFYALNRDGQMGYEAERDNPVVLRVYPVPTERAQDIRTALAGTLDNAGGKAPPLGRVMLSGTNQLVVLAPLATHASIDNAIAKLGGGTKAVAADAPAGVRLDFWILDAVPGATADDAALAPLAPALGAVRASVGGHFFRVHDTLAISTIPNGGMAEVASGLGTRASAHLRPIAQGVQVDLEVSGAGPGRISTTTALPFGQYVVLAQIATSAEGGAPGTPRLYVVRAEPAAARG
jgi:hypothetical protein